MISRFFLILVLALVPCASRAFEFGDLFGYSQPTTENTYDFLWKRGSFYTDMSDTGWFASTFSTDVAFLGNKITHLKVGKITHTTKDDTDHYSAEITFTIANSKNGVEVAGQIFYYRGLKDNLIYWDDKPWKQTGAKKIGKW